MFLYFRVGNLNCLGDEMQRDVAQDSTVITRGCVRGGDEQRNVTRTMLVDSTLRS